MNNRSYNLNEVLKARKTARQDRQAQDGEVKLDDLSRVKVLSPGRQVFKRFIRNRLAVFGSVTLIVMFLFSFVGPLFYPYGQKQIFYTYEPRNVDYAMVKENTAYSGYDIEGDALKDSLHSATVERTINNKMNSIIKNMLAVQADVDYVQGDEKAYRIEKLSDDVYLVSAADREEVCAYGSVERTVGTYSMVGKKLEFEADPVEGLEDAIREAIPRPCSRMVLPPLFGPVSIKRFSSGEKEKSFFTMFFSPAKNSRIL